MKRMTMEEIIEKSNDYYFIVSDGKIYVSEGYASDIDLGEEVLDLTVYERPKGKWLPTETWDDKCSICNKKARFNYNYCPHCGAEMEV